MRARTFAGLGLLSLLALTGAAVPASAAPAAAPAKPAVTVVPPSALACGETHADKDNSAYPEPFGEATNVRSGPSTDCGINGVAGANNKADYHCYVSSGGHSWTYLRFKDTHYGFVRDDLLSDNGSYVAC